MGFEHGPMACNLVKKWADMIDMAELFWDRSRNSFDNC